MEGKAGAQVMLALAVLGCALGTCHARSAGTKSAEEVNRLAKDFNAMTAEQRVEFCNEQYQDLYEGELPAELACKAYRKADI